MRLLRRAMGVFVCVCAYHLMFPKDACAYIDPGSGNFLWQTLVALFAGAAYTVRHWWSSIVGFVQKGKKSSTAGENAPAEKTSASHDRP